MEAQRLKEQGIQQSLFNADLQSSVLKEGELYKWSEIAYNFLLNFLRTNKGSSFMVEDIRAKSEESVPEPPSKRAWGGIILKAKREGLIRHIGYRQVKNPKAHMANASLWAVN